MMVSRGKFFVFAYQGLRMSLIDSWDFSNVGKSSQQKNTPEVFLSWTPTLNAHDPSAERPVDRHRSIKPLIMKLSSTTNHDDHHNHAFHYIS